MLETLRRLFLSAGKPRPEGRSSRSGAVSGSVETLESRELPAIVGLSASASPEILRPINPMNQPHAVQVAKIRPVTLAGYVSEQGGATPSVSFRVVDQFGRDQPSGTFRVQPVQPGLFFFHTRIGLSLARRAADPSGRHYTVIFTAQDSQNSKTIAVPVTTPPLPHNHK
jgi:hypothetical protein